MQKSSIIKVIVGFAALFTCYHGAEYMVMYKNSSIGFLLITSIFFLVAWLIARWQKETGLTAWGIIFNRTTGIFLFSGLLVGLAINIIAYLLSIYLNIQVLGYIPSTIQFIEQSALLIFGCCLSSLTEDILTRGYIYKHFHGRVSNLMLVLLSATVYVLNHIHRLNEPVYLLYLFLIGINLIIPFFFTRNIWYTLGVHWAGNIVYHITNNVMHTDNGTNPFSALWLMIIFMALLIPVNYFIARCLTRPGTKTESLTLQPSIA
jgi:hypothetical protein